ncbi:hypothetical protein KJ636_03220 [Patescibacteria group bacterium]|nr:hypothetical protein [Patescibacteria group bacterium]
MREKLKIFRPEKGEKGEPETKIEKAGIEKKRKGEEKTGAKEGIPDVAELKLTRREFLKKAGLVVGGVLAPELVAGCVGEDKKGEKEIIRPEEKKLETEKEKLETEKEMKEIRQGLVNRLKQLVTEVREVDTTEDRYYRIDSFNISKGEYNVSISKNEDLSYLAHTVAEYACVPPLEEPSHNILEIYDKLLETAKKEKNNEAVLSLLDRLFSSSATLHFPEGWPVELSEEEKNDAVAGYKKFNETVRRKGFAAYEEFKRLNATEKKDTWSVKNLGNEYKTAIQKILAGIYSAKVLELYSPQGEVKFYSKLEDVYGKPKVKDFEPLDKAPGTRAYLSDFYKNVLELPVPSTLREDKK